MLRYSKKHVFPTIFNSQASIYVCDSDMLQAEYCYLIILLMVFWYHGFENPHFSLLFILKHSLLNHHRNMEILFLPLLLPIWIHLLALNSAAALRTIIDYTDPLIVYPNSPYEPAILPCHNRTSLYYTASAHISSAKLSLGGLKFWMLVPQGRCGKTEDLFSYTVHIGSEEIYPDESDPHLDDPEMMWFGAYKSEGVQAADFVCAAHLEAK
ncbi:hypothetical protein CPB83DRAFT_840742 [Crepidotus variabilis]|uniref:Uncharacterized protein n=1 Tax=Crepidotus variabilis TaxID=179855 RepID=A0A9P6JII0_9AGAR|nr:hypothetical protein CPB83DRAFT_840742 [Crepidotus variabilis]